MVREKFDDLINAILMLIYNLLYRLNFHPIKQTRFSRSPVYTITIVSVIQRHY